MREGSPQLNDDHERSRDRGPKPGQQKQTQRSQEHMQRGRMYRYRLQNLETAQK